MTNCTMYSVTIILVCLLYGSYAKMIFESPAELAGSSILARQFIFLGPEDKINVTARVIKSDPHRGCEWSEVKNKDDWEGNIVIVERDAPSCAPAQILRNAEKGGAIAVFMIQQPGEYNALPGTRYLDDYNGPVYALNGIAESQKLYDDIIKYTANNSIIVTATVHGDGIGAHTGYNVATSVTCGLFALFNIIFGSFKLYEFVQEKGKFEASLPQMCLWIEIFGNFERVLLSLEPDVGIGWGVLDWGSISFFQELILPFCLTPSLMIAFYWDRSLRSFGKTAGDNWNMFSIQRWKIPLVIFCTLILLLQIFKATLVCLWYGSKELAIVIFLIAAACFLGVGLFFTITGIKVLRWASNTRSTHSEKSKALSTMTKLVVANAFWLLWGFAMHIVMIFSWEAGWMPLLFGLNCTSLIQMWIFQPTAANYSSSGTTAHSKKMSNAVELPDITTTRSDSV